MVGSVLLRTRWQDNSWAYSRQLLAHTEELAHTQDTSWRLPGGHMLEGVRISPSPPAGVSAEAQPAELPTCRYTYRYMPRLPNFRHTGTHTGTCRSSDISVHIPVHAALAGKRTRG
jgi:hypothetical protein